MPFVTPQRSVDFRFASLKRPQRVWAIPSIHGQVAQLQTLHDALISRVKPGDRIVYMGNYLGHGTEAASVIDELLTFRRMVLAMAGFQPKDFAYLRGAQEEMLQRVYQLQFASSPWQIYEWMLGQGLWATLASYGIDAQEGLNAASQNALRLSRWTDHVRQMVQRRPGHDIFYTHMKRAAFTALTHLPNGKTEAPAVATDGHAPLLFVNAGLNTERSLDEQGDRFWWGDDDFNMITDAYNPFARVVRGFDHQRRGLHINCVTATLDNNCGFGGTLACASLLADASVGEVLEA